MNSRAAVARAFLGLVLAPIVLESVLADEPAEVVTHLFTEWSKIDAGNAVFPLDLSRVSAEDRELIEKVYDYYKVTMRLAERPEPQRALQTVEMEATRLVDAWIRSTWEM